MMDSLALRRSFLQRADFVKRLNEDGRAFRETQRRQHAEAELRNFALPRRRRLEEGRLP